MPQNQYMSDWTNIVSLYAAPMPVTISPIVPTIPPSVARYMAPLPSTPIQQMKKKFKTFVPGDSRLHTLGINGRIICVDAEGEYFKGSTVYELINGNMYTITQLIEHNNVITHVRVKELDNDVYDVRRFIPAPPTPEELARDKSRINLIDLSDRNE